MLAKNQKTLELSKSYTIYQICPALNHSSYVMLANKTRHGPLFIIHLSSTGKILKQIDIQRKAKLIQFTMISDKECAYVVPTQNCFVILNLEDYAFRKIKHYFIDVESDRNQIIFFKQTRYLCIAEKVDSFLKLSYFKENYESSFCEFQSEQNQWTSKSFLNKSNERSMICFWTQNRSKNPIFYYFELTPLQQKILQKVVLLNEQLFPVEYKMSQSFIFRINQIQKGKFMIICQNIYSQRHYESKQVLIWLSQTNQLRHADFYLQESQDDLCEYFDLGTVSVFITCKEQEGQEHISYFYVDNQMESILREDKRVITLKTASIPFFQLAPEKVWSISYDSDLFIELNHNYEEISTLEVTTTKILHKSNFSRQNILGMFVKWDIRQIALSFLIQMNEDFDEDLLQDIIEMIQSSYNQVMEFNSNMLEEVRETNAIISFSKLKELSNKYL